MEKIARPKCKSCTRLATIGSFCVLHSGNRCACGLTTGARCTVCRTKPGLVKRFEMQVKCMLEGHDTLDVFIHNKKVPGTALSPDFLWEHASHAVILEVDEYGHKSYDPSKEIRRMQLISSALKKETIFVRLYVPSTQDIMRSAIEILEALTNDPHQIVAPSNGIVIRRFFNEHEL